MSAIVFMNESLPASTASDLYFSIEVAMKEIGGSFPVIAKTITGAEGIGVMKLESSESLTSVLQGLWKHGGEITRE